MVHKSIEIFCSNICLYSNRIVWLNDNAFIRTMPFRDNGYHYDDIIRYIPLNPESKGKI